LKAIAWDQVGESVIAMAWREFAMSHSRWLSEFTAEAIPIGQREFIRLGSGLMRPDEHNVNGDERIARAVYVLGVALGVLLLDDGWKVSSSPGTPVVIVHGSHTFDVFGAVRALADERTTAESWTAECHTLGLAGRPLGSAAATAGIGTPTRATGPARTTAALKPSALLVKPVTRTDGISCWRSKHALPIVAEKRGKTVRCPQCGTKQEMPL